jgi:monoamine oxidase
MSKSFTKAHVVGAGLAGLNAATVLAQAGIAVSLSDSAARAGALPLLFRPVAGADHRQWQPSGAGQQSGGEGIPRPHRCG